MGSRFSMILGVLLLLAPSSWAQAPAYFEGCKLHAHTSAKTAVSADFNPVRIFKQHLSIALNPAVRHISGQVHYRLQLIEARPQLALDLDAALQVDSVWSGNQAIAFSQNALQLLLTAPNGMWPADSTLEFSVQYAGVPPVNTNGFGSFMTAKHGPDSVPVLWTLSQPYGCRDWWPAFQTLGIRADTTWLSVNIPIGYRVGGPGLLQRIDTLGSRVVYHWQHVYSMPPYLLGLAVSEYEVLEQHIPIAGSNDTVFVQDYVYLEDTAYAFPRLRELLPPMLQRFTDLFGPYPYLREKYGHMQISIFSGGMEHSTMSSMGSWDYSLMVHELAHQWFGNKITCASWRDIWVNEGFATWMVSLCLEDLLDNGFWWPGWKDLTRKSALRVPEGSIYVRDTALTTNIFSQRLTYHKASFVLHGLRYQIGDSAMFAGLRSYMNDPQLSWAFATTEHIRYFLEQASGQDLRGYFDRYIYGAGYPRYQVNWQQQGGQLQLHTRQLQPQGLSFAQRLPIRAYGAGDSLDIHIDFRGPQRSDVVTVPFTIDSLVFDPEIFVLSEPAVVQRLSGLQQGDFFASLNNDLLQIQLPFDLPPNAGLRLYDLQGRLLHWQLVPDGQLYQEIRLTQWLKPGMYLLQLQSGNEQATKKLILAK